MRSYCCHIWLGIGTIFIQYITIFEYDVTPLFKKKKNYNLGGLESLIMQKKD